MGHRTYRNGNVTQGTCIQKCETEIQLFDSIRKLFSLRNLTEENINSIKSADVSERILSSAKNRDKAFCDLSCQLSRLNPKERKFPDEIHSEDSRVTITKV